MLSCRCGSAALTITDQSYTPEAAFEQYECDDCGATGSLQMVEGATGLSKTTSGCLTAE